MTRLLYNNASGHLGASLTNSGTTITFAGTPNFATLVSPDYIPLILGSGTPLYEIVYLTAYTAGATTGTITRGAEDSANWPAVAHPSGTWSCGPTVFDTQAPSNVPAGRIYATTSQALYSAGFIQIVFGHTSYLRGGMTVGTNSLVVPVAGIYSIQSQQRLQSAGAQETTIAVYKNGVEASEGTLNTTGGTSNVSQTLADTLLLAAGDILTVEAFTSSTNFNSSLASTGYSNFLAAHLVSS